MVQNEPQKGGSLHPKYHPNMKEIYQRKTSISYESIGSF